jgi:hypothetical protein
MRSRKSKKLRALLRENSDEEEDMDDIGGGFDDPQRPWVNDYQAYMGAPEKLPQGWTAVQWWGVSGFILIIIAKD